MTANNRIEPGGRIAQGFGMAVNVKLVGLHGIKHHLRHLGCADFAAANRFIAHGLAYQLALRGLGG